jgi:hypothetical protein
MYIQNSINILNSNTPYHDSIEYKSDMINELRNRFNNTTYKNYFEGGNVFDNIILGTSK